MKKRQQSEGISVEERERRKAKKKKKEEARAAEKAAAEAGEDDCSAANPKCKRPTGKQVSSFDDIPVATCSVLAIGWNTISVHHI